MTKGLSPNQLETIRRDTNRIVPMYFLTQFDALKAIEDGVGNCFSKVAISCGLISLRHQVEPSLVYKKSIHGVVDPSISKPKDPRTNRNIAHVAMVVPSPSPDTDLSFPTLHFGIAVYQGGSGFTARDPGGVERTYNFPDQYIEASPDGDIRATETAKQHGIYAGAWRSVVPEYLGAIGRDPLDVEILIGRLAAIEQKAA